MCTWTWTPSFSMSGGNQKNCPKHRPKLSPYAWVQRDSSEGLEVRWSITKWGLLITHSLASHAWVAIHVMNSTFKSNPRAHGQGTRLTRWQVERKTRRNDPMADQEQDQDVNGDRVILERKTGNDQNLQLQRQFVIVIISFPPHQTKTSGSHSFKCHCSAIGTTWPG